MGTTLTIRSIRSRAVSVPMRFALGTSAQKVRVAPLLLIDLETEEGITGRTYLFCYMPMGAALVGRVLQEALIAIKGEAIDPAKIGARLGRQFRLIAASGVVGLALSAIDVACWDALAIAAGKPLAEFLGGARRAVRGYNSNGLGLMPTAKLADEAEELLEGGFRGMKLRLGYATLAEDLAAVRAVRKRLPEDVAIMTDYNQALTVEEALERGRALDGEGLAWIEEPVEHDDYAGCARIAARTRDADSDRRKFRRPERDGGGHGGTGCGLHDAGPCAHRRSERLASCGIPCSGIEDSLVVASLAGGERGVAGGESDKALARICGLGVGDSGKADAGGERHADAAECAGKRHQLERGGGRPVSHGLAASRLRHLRMLDGLASSLLLCFDSSPQRG